MKLIIVIIFAIVYLLNYVNKNKNNKGIGTKSAAQVTPKPNNPYCAVGQDYNSNSKKAFMESNTYQTSPMMNEQAVSREAVIEGLTEFNKALDKRRAEKESKKTKQTKAANQVQPKKAASKPYSVISKPENEEKFKESSYGFGIFDDFAASDTLYLARKDVEMRKQQRTSYI